MGDSAPRNLIGADSWRKADARLAAELAGIQSWGLAAWAPAPHRHL